MSIATTSSRGASATKSLFHYGKKGMKWGVRNDGSGGAKPRGKIRRGITKANTALTVGDKVIDKGEKKLIFLPQDKRAKAAAATQSRLLDTARQINKDPQFKGKDIKRDPALKAAYSKAIEREATKIYKEELGVARVEATMDAINAVMNVRGDRVKVTAPADQVRHDDSNLETLLELAFDLDDLGQIADVTVPPAYLQHYGVKGMKWGVTTVDRAAQPTLTREKQTRIMNTKDVTVTQRKAGKYAKAKGGQRQKATDDAVKAVAARQKAKKSTTDSLTNDELKAANERMRLEQEFAKLNSKTKRRGEGFIAQLFQTPEARKTSADLLKRVAEQNK